MSKKITTEIFINKAHSVHMNTYDYSIVNYVGCKINVIILCPKHGEFSQTPDKHLHGHGCPKCVGYNKSTEDFLTASKLIHNNKYDYSLVKYCGAKSNVIILCSKHGKFNQTPDSHLHGYGCPKCGYEENGKYFASSKEEFIQKAKIAHCEIYDYLYVNYVNAKTNVNIICKKHGVFKQKPDNHLHGKGCPLCKSSLGELAIKKYLDEHNIEYIKEKIFENCKNIFQLPFDYYLPKQNMLLEYDGIQHFIPIKHFGGEIAYNSLKKRDEIKNNFAKNNNIGLLRIKYNEINNINQILKEII